jgi:hypothetical protein
MISSLKCAQKFLLKSVLNFAKMAIFAFRISGISGTRKVSGKFPSEKSDFWKISCEIFCRNRYIFEKTRKTAKKKTVFRFRGFQDFRGRLSGIFSLYRLHWFYLCTLLRRAVSEKPAQTFSGSDFGNRENFPRNFRAVFRRFSFFRNFRISEIGPNFLKFKMAHNIAF